VKKLIVLSLVASIQILFSQDLEKDGVEVQVTKSDGKKESVEIYRDLPDECALDVKINPSNIWGEAYASSKVPNDCKVTLVSTIGKVSPIKIADGVETYGELEVLKFLKDKSSNKLFIDSRTPKWYKHQTIPSAINIPFTYFFKPKEHKKEFEESLKLMGVTKDNKGYNFKNAKELLLFCNGAWCGQSPMMIKKLLKLGYPPKKIKWYRGGMHSWLSLNFSSTRDKEYPKK